MLPPLFESLESRVLLSSDSTPFVHPGLFETNADFARMVQEVAVGAHPWIDSWNILTANSHAQLSYTPSPVSILIRGTTSVGPENYSHAYNDTAAAYQLALRWKITGDTRYADAAINVLNAWSSTLTEITGDSNADLAAGLYGYQFAVDGEIMRTYSGWSATDFARFQGMMKNIFYPINNDFLTNHNGTTSSHYWANWDLCNMASEMAIGVLCDDHTIYDQAITYFKSGLGTGDINNAVYFEYPGKLGQWQESGRDQGHATLGVPLIAAIAQMAWNQGDDLYSYEDNRILQGVEYIAKYNLGYDVPYTTYINSDGVVDPTISSASRGTIRTGFETIYNHYVNIEGLAAPYTAAYAAMIRPDGGGGNYGSTSGGYDQLGFNTLTDTLDPIALGSAPSGLATVVTGSQAQLSWWGTAYATSYNIKRSTSAGGIYVTIATGVTNNTYTDYGLAPGITCYYEVSAVTPTGETANSNSASAVADLHLTGSVIGSTGSYNSLGAGIQDVFDGSLTDYYDAASASGDWAGLDVGAGVTDVITQIRFCPRPNFASRMIGGVFQASNTPDFSSGVQTLYTVTSAPAYGVMTTVSISNPNAFRYVRYLGPTNGSCNIAEAEFDGYNSAAAAPALPSGLAASAQPTGVILGWTAASGAVGYTIQRSTSANTGFTTIASGVTTTNYTDTNAIDGMTYYYILSATNSAGSSSNTAPVSATTLVPPAGLAVSVTGSGTVNLSWNVNASATGYNVERALTTDGPYTVIATVTSNSYPDTSGTASDWMPYYYVVTALNGSSQSRISTQVEAIPAAPFVTQNGSTLNISLSSAGPVSLGASGGGVTVNRNGNQAEFADVISIVVTETGKGDTLNITGPLTIPISFTSASTSIVNVNAGTMTIAALPGGSVNIGSLTVASGAMATIAIATTSQPTTLDLSSLTILGSGQLNIANNVIFIDYGSNTDPISSIASWLATGYNGGAWNGSGGIISSIAAINPSYGVGYADAADPGNPAQLSPDTIKIMYTLLGDADLNGIVNGIDFGILSANFNKGVTGWDQGDFDYNGIVNGLDFGDLSANFNKGIDINANLPAVVSTGTIANPMKKAANTQHKPKFGSH